MMTQMRHSSLFQDCLVACQLIFTVMFRFGGCCCCVFLNCVRDDRHCVKFCAVHAVINSKHPMASVSVFRYRNCNENEEKIACDARHELEISSQLHSNYDTSEKKATASQELNVCGKRLKWYVL